VTPHSWQDVGLTSNPLHSDACAAGREWAIILQQSQKATDASARCKLAIPRERSIILGCHPAGLALDSHPVLRACRPENADGRKSEERDLHAHTSFLASDVVEGGRVNGEYECSA